MQITRQADYALRTVLYLARLGREKRAPTNKIASEQKIPISFLAKIISQLALAGMLETSRGAHGGVSLALPPKEISMLAVVEAIDGPIWLNECVFNPSSCYFGESCPIHEIWCKTQADLVEKLKNTTFDMLLVSS